MPKKPRPIAVLISDVHASIPTLDLAIESLRQAREKSDRLSVPMIVAGDLTDGKAIIRGEVANALIAFFDTPLRPLRTKYIVLVGNHDKINEKGAAHSLEFLRPFCQIVDEPNIIVERCLDSNTPEVRAIPYLSDSTELPKLMEGAPKGTIFIMHQGVKGAYMGEYVVDKSSVDPELLKDYRCISGHYHRTQTIGTLTYIGSPYTITFAEANDPPKGFQILMSDGSLEHVPTNLRKHVILETSATHLLSGTPISCQHIPGDKVWLKVSGPKSDLDLLNKKRIGEQLFGGEDFRLDKIPTEADAPTQSRQTFTDTEIMQQLIAESGETPEMKALITELWQEIMS